jgi:hypothetical protein
MDGARSHLREAGGYRLPQQRMVIDHQHREQLFPRVRDHVRRQYAGWRGSNGLT